MVSNTELILHIIIFVVAILTPFVIYLSYSKLPSGDLKRIVKILLISYIFSSLRWMGGSLARLDVSITNSLLFNFVWTLTGIVAAITALCATKLLLNLSLQIKKLNIPLKVK
ncbi:MAG: hypothetical protein AABW88_02195 [Nanoarchaeota archaeon]